MIRGPVISLALVLSGSALWSAFVTGDLNTTTALYRFMLAVLVSGVMLAVLRSVTANYRRDARRRQLLRRLPAHVQDQLRQQDRA